MAGGGGVNGAKTMQVLYQIKHADQTDSSSSPADYIPASGSATGGVRAARALRALRPLRSITRFQSLRTIVVCFLEVRCL